MKQVKALRSTMTPVVLREMAMGLDPKKDMFAQPEAYLFGGRLGLTYKAEKMKLDKEEVEVKLGSVEYDFHRIMF